MEAKAGKKTKINLAKKINLKVRCFKIGRKQYIEIKIFSSSNLTKRQYRNKRRQDSNVRIIFRKKKRYFSKKNNVSYKLELISQPKKITLESQGEKLLLTKCGMSIKKQQKLQDSTN